jgi:hypothetical protein
LGDILISRDVADAADAEAALVVGALAVLCRPLWVGSTSEGNASPARKIQAMVLPTGTSSPGRALIPARTPFPGDSTSIRALSVSTSRSGSPFVTASPSFFSQETSLPVSWAISRAGITTLMGIQLARELKV